MAIKSITKDEMMNIFILLEIFDRMQNAEDAWYDAMKSGTDDKEVKRLRGKYKLVVHEWNDEVNRQSNKTNKTNKTR